MRSKNKGTSLGGVRGGEGERSFEEQVIRSGNYTGDVRSPIGTHRCLFSHFQGRGEAAPPFFCQLQGIVRRRTPCNILVLGWKKKQEQQQQIDS